MKIKFFKEHIINYEDRVGLSKKTVTISLLYLWVMLSFSIFYIGKLTMTVLLLFIGITVSIHIVWISKAKKKGIIK